MEEYEFRAKPTENNTTYFSKDDFVYGLLLKDDDKYYICLNVNEHIDRDDYEVYMIEVIPETIGQYTGLKDKNGKKIFEGDIVKKETFDDTKPNFTNISYAKVIYIEKLAGFYLVNRDDKILWDVGADKYNIEVVSTIYDNPDLLKEEL